VEPIPPGEKSNHINTHMVNGKHFGTLAEKVRKGKTIQARITLIWEGRKEEPVAWLISAGLATALLQ
jgi:hypothetical protein